MWGPNCLKYSILPPTYTNIVMTYLYIYIYVYIYIYNIFRKAPARRLASGVNALGPPQV